ncbi:MAG: SpoIIE family protein phosphatase, partial [Oscillospiraceae bacterium]|nr:SpoIIE family protein phosphatase [Oscillospiraceae bacterium]
MNDLCTDIGYRSLNKFGEQLCGDHVDMVEGQDGSTIIVLADGLGSGVKASILSTLTAKIISTMLAAGLSVEDCIATIAATLPVCSERKVAYSTFTIIRINGTEEAEIIQFDNPHVILLRGGKNYELPIKESTVEGKNICYSRIGLLEGDTFIAVSDGAIYA